MSFEKSRERRQIKDAACNGQLGEVIELSVKFFNDVSLLSETLTYSCMRGHLHVLNWLIKNTAADVNYNGHIKVKNVWKHNEFFTPLTAACCFEHLDIVKLLIKISRVSINVPDTKCGYTPLIIACGYVSMSVTMYLLQQINDLNVNITDRFRGDTALHKALWCSKNDGFTQLHWASREGDIAELVKFLYSHENIINSQDNNGYTALHWACHYGHGDIVKVLMSAGADERITNDSYKTPAQIAKRRHSKLSDYLNRVNLWQFLHKNKLNKLSVGFILLSFLQFMTKLQKKRKWRQLLTIVYVVMLIGKSKCHHAKRKRHIYLIDDSELCRNKI